MLLIVLYYFCLLLFPTASGSTGFFNFAFGFQKYCLCRCGLVTQFSDAVRSGRLLGGEAVFPHQFPWLVNVNAGTESFVGSLISDRHVVTAASPVFGVPANNVTVTLGAHDRCTAGYPGLTNSVSAVTVHPGYSSTNRDNDIALIKLRHVIGFNEFISPICMPFYGSQERGRVAWTVSWAGQLGNSTCTPRVTTLPMLHKRTCLAATENTNLLTLDKGCLGPVGHRSVICKADVGAPIMSRWNSGAPFRLLGIISSASCEKESPPLYTRIIEHDSWIHSHVRSDCQCF